MTDADVGLESGLPATGGESAIDGPSGMRSVTMDWEGFFTNYKKPGFIPGFEIVNKLGSGVFGEVYKARKESIGKFYAIKFLKINDEKMSEAIFKELDSLKHFAQLDHPNLVTIEDRGEVMGIPYVVMGYAGDETLKKRLEVEGVLRGENAVEVFRQICGGVQALHEKSIIHFDLKPANVFLKGDHARVGDYGLSKLVSESHKTMSIGRGTPYYMAPEMLHKTGDHRSDIYSLGVILFQIVTGRVPFTGDSDWAVLKKHEAEPVSVPLDIEPRIRQVISRCMEKRPEARYQSVKEVMASLDGVATYVRSSPGRPSSTPIPPPLPSRTPMARPLPPGQGPAKAPADVQKRQMRAHVRDLARRVSSSARADQAKARYDGARSSRPSQPVRPAAMDSFYTDFDHVDDAVGASRSAASMAPEPDHREVAKAPAEVASPAMAAEAAVPAKRGPLFWILTWPFWLVWFAVLLPIGLLFKGLGRLLVMIGRGLAVFFANFVRYAVVLMLTAGFAFLIHAAIRGFRP